MNKKKNELPKSGMLKNKQMAKHQVFKYKIVEIGVAVDDFRKCKSVQGSLFYIWSKKEETFVIS